MAEAIVSWSGLRSRMADRPLSLAQEVWPVQTTEIRLRRRRGVAWG